jgi:hypothetical protein
MKGANKTRILKFHDIGEKELKQLLKLLILIKLFVYEKNSYKNREKTIRTRNDQ